ncbi:hypothetical protein [Chelativorans sp. Marseille-P2723]|uniref:hypothetical protein n=1 Tax=Chelativorans sp. Marseille-P2723 TaxID=2709133 RepID=UPI0015713EC0|nr:hypothetical protein [Chelativorans sp. Marseille-P2723]
MKGLSFLTALGLLGAASFAILGDNENPTHSVSKQVQEHKEALLAYQLQVSGREGSCTVVRHGGANALRAELDLDHECIALMPRLAEARYWRQDASGGVTFVAADGRPIVEFFAADGVAYESLRPVAPLVALTAK